MWRKNKLVTSYCENEHLVGLYQASKKRTGNIENNLVNNSDSVDLTHLDVSDFFKDTEGKIDHLIGDGNIHND